MVKLPNVMRKPLVGANCRGGEGLAGEAASVVADEEEVADPANESGLDTLASR